MSNSFQFSYNFNVWPNKYMKKRKKRRKITKKKNL